jgi:hypothetical protein
MTEHPMQPVHRDPDGVIRFRPNKVVRFLLDWATGRGMGMNELALMPFSVEDREQFAQLIGYSVSGFGELYYVRGETIDRADAAADALPAERS